MTRSLAAALVALAFATGCATVMTKSAKSFTLRTAPDGARFVVRRADRSEPVREGITPMPLFLSRGARWFEPVDYTIALSKDGYADQTVRLPTRISGWYWMNILLLAPGWFCMFFVDPFTGAMWEIDAPDTIALQPTGMASSQ